MLVILYCFQLTNLLNANSVKTQCGTIQDSKRKENSKSTSTPVKIIRHGWGKDI